MSRANPWDIPPPPSTGDGTEDITFAAVGRALTAWEYFESHLSWIFAEMTGTDRVTSAALRAYGAVMTFNGRADMVQAAAEVFFAGHWGDDLASALKKLIKTAQRYAPRRNEIAHGIVQSLNFRSGAGFCLLPSAHATNKNEIIVRHYAVPDFELRPKYTYSSSELNTFAALFRTELTVPAVPIYDKIADANWVARVSASPRSRPERTP